MTFQSDPNALEMLSQMNEREKAEFFGTATTVEIHSYEVVDEDAPRPTLKRVYFPTIKGVIVTKRARTDTAGYDTWLEAMKVGIEILEGWQEEWKELQA